MDIAVILGIAIGLAMDAFAVSIVVGSRLQRIWFRPFFRLSFHFGLFQFLMPIIGWYAGSTVAHLIKAYDHWVAFGLLVVIGSNMIRESFQRDREEIAIHDPTRKWSLVMLSVATSIDALAVGLSLAMIDVDILYPSVIIGIVALVMTAFGMSFGRKLGERFGKLMGFAGGIILIVIGIKILVEHLF